MSKNIKFIPKSLRVQPTIEKSENADAGTTTTSLLEIQKHNLSKKDQILINQRYLFQEEKTSKKLKRNLGRKDLFDWDSKDDTGSLFPKPFSFENQSNIKQKVVKAIDEFGNEVKVKVSGGKRQISSLDDERHWSQKSVKEMNDRDWRIFKEDFNISIMNANGVRYPNPLRFWDEADFLGNEMLNVLERDCKYKEPTPIQRQVIPIINKGIDLIGIAETGSGKTAAFVVPLVSQILRKCGRLTKENYLDGPFSIVLAPTRELVQQIEKETKKICRPLGLECISIVGGHSMAEQSVKLRKGAEIVIATPGRFRDCLEQRVLALNQCFCCVLDEADRMIDMNFEEDLNFILAFSTSNYCGNLTRQITMFSATMPPEVEKIAKSYMNKPVSVKVGSSEIASENIEQRIEMFSTGSETKEKKIVKILMSSEFRPPIIIFVNQKVTVDFLSRRLDNLGFKNIPLHGGMSQQRRESSISKIHNKTSNILIATDVAGRGIDIKNVSLVLNYDMPKSIEDYIHRIGRTGRAGEMGVAISFLTENDSELFYSLKKLLQKSPKSILPKQFLDHPATLTKPGSIIIKKRKDEKIFAYGV